MFIKRNALKALMTRAYKGGGLAVRNDGVGLSIGGAKWCVYIMHGDMPKETMGDLISLVGELPGEGEAYVADKNGNQMEIYDSSLLSPMDLEPHTELTVIPLIVCGSIGILRELRTGHIIPVPFSYLQAIDYGSLMKDEATPDGPFGISAMVEGRFYNAACWQNNMMAFSIGDSRIENERVKKLLGQLEALPLTEETIEESGRE